MTRRTRASMAIAFAWLAASGAGCGPDGPEKSPISPLFASDWETTYAQVRPCRKSTDHDLQYVRILADSKAKDTYLSRTGPFPEGAVVLKAEYEEEGCNTLTGYTVMRKEAAGYDPPAGDWRWQRADAEGTVTEDGQIARCRSCHMTDECHPEVPGPQTGWDFTCAWP